MKKNVFIETVYQRVYGGRPSTDFSVLRADIEAYLPACVNYALTAGYYQQQSAEGNRDIPTQFYHYYECDVITDNSRRRKPYIVVPATMVALPSNRGLRMVMDDCEHPYIPVDDNHISNIDYWMKILCSQRFYRLEGKKIFLYNKPSSVESMKVLMLVEVGDLQPNDELSIPAGGESAALDMCFEFVTGIRKLPVDRKEDGRDLN